MRAGLALGISVLVGVLFLAGCGPSEKSVREALEVANFCTADADCVDLGGRCPFGCYLYVNKEKADAMRELLDEYEKGAGAKTRCDYQCLKCDQFACVSGRCEVLCGGGPPHIS
jgi:hypothetical protein